MRTATARRPPPPRWRLLYGVAILMVAALGAVEVVSVPNGVRTAARCALVVAGFLAMAAWVRLDRAALDQRNWCACAAKSVAVRVIRSRRPEPPAGAADGRALPGSEVGRLHEAAREEAAVR